MMSKLRNKGIDGDEMDIRRSLLALLVLWMAGGIALHAVTVTAQPWGKDQTGNPVDLYTLKDQNAEVQLTTYSARIVSISVPDKSGQMSSVVLGSPSLDGYLQGRVPFEGATIGRFANRLAGGEFHLDGNAYEIPKNNGGNTLHGGTLGFDRKVWSAKPTADGVIMTLVSPDGDMGFPGNLTVSVDFELRRQRGAPALSIRYTAETDHATVINLTNHSYFNLANDPSAPVFDDIARIDADKYTPLDGKGIPTGTIEPVEGTALDFREAHPIGKSIPERGYDHNFVLRKHKATVAVAEVSDPVSGRDVQVFTNQPGLQFYVPKSPAPPPNANAPVRRGTAAFCLETQHFPDSPNQPSFPTTTLMPGSTFHSITTYVFTIKRN
jgi:aldose 1-epimerase